MQSTMGYVILKRNANMKILIYGAGVIGSVYAARLKEAGQDATLLARGRRLEELQKEGLVLEDTRTGCITRTVVPLVDHLEPEDAYDLVIVVMRRNQTRAILPVIAANKRIPSVLFLVNNAAGPQEWIEALGKNRVLIGLPNTGGEKRGNVVRYFLMNSLTILFNELDEIRTARVDQIIQMFQCAHLSAAAQKDMDAYMKTHIALVAPAAGAIYMAGGDIHRLAYMRESLMLLVRAIREGFKVLSTLDIPITPSAMNILNWIPERMLIFLLRMLFTTKMAVVGMERHANSAPDEM
jgi:2-dehydropantoate 2-reductase